MTSLDKAQLVRLFVELREKCDEALAVLCPSDEPDTECLHDKVEDVSEMGTELYRCLRCGTERTTPFPNGE